MRNARLWVRLTILLAITLAALGLWQWQTRPATAQSQVESAWQTVRRSERYAFSADVAMETIPLPTVGNIGRFSKTDGLYLEGVNDQRNDTLQLALWGGSVSAADPTAAYHVRVQDGRVQTRAGDDPWQDGQSADVAFAPDGDFLAFLDYATDIAWLGEAHEGGQTVTKYSFTIDGAAYANHMRQITQQRLVAEGSLPAGVALATPTHLAAMHGTGELWIDARGLPVREIVRMAMPAAEGADYRTNADLTIYFSGYEGVDFAVNWWQPLRSAGFALSQIALPSGLQVAANASILLATLLLVALLVRARVSRRAVVIFNSAVLALIVLSPAAQIGTSRAAAATLTRYYAANDLTPPDPLGDAGVRAGFSPAPAIDIAQLLAPRRPNVPLNSINLQTGSVDSDGDGLSDELERLIGSDPRNPDSDFDTISDGDEVTGFLVGSTRWYGNPLNPDSNDDTIPDTAEWNPAAPDSDGDGTPDLYDWDDDNDGVPDSVDISRIVGSKDNGGASVSFDQANPFVFALNGMRPDSFAYVTLQLRPTNPDHLWYAFNVLNWPKDEKGNMQDWDGRTLFDYCMATGGSNCNMTPDANGDLKIVPMLEIAIPDLANLPRLANGRPDETLMANYGMSLQPVGDGSYLIYAPLNLVTEQTTGARAAFQAQLLYQAGASFAPQRMRLVWAVQALQEQYADPDAYKAAQKNGSAATNNKLTVLYAYQDGFTLTGLNVREDRGVEMAIVYESPVDDDNLNEDAPLIHLAGGLRDTYFNNRDCDLVDNAGKCVGDGRRDITIAEIKRRWDMHSNTGITTGQRWGIEDRLRVQTYSFRHDDEATIVAGGTHAPAILNGQFTGTGAQMPALLLVREARLKSLNVDARYANGPIGWSGRTLSINLAQQPLVTHATINTAYYRYDNGWKAATPAEVVAETTARYPVGDNGRDGGRDGGPTITDFDQYQTAVEVVLVQQGDSKIIAAENSSSTLTSALTAGGTIGGIKPVDITDENLRHLYASSLTAIGSLVPLIVRFRTDLFVTLPKEFGFTVGATQFNANRLEAVMTQLNSLNGDRTNFAELTKQRNLLQKTSAPPTIEEGVNITFTDIDNSQFRRYVSVIGYVTLIAGAIALVLSNIKGTQTVGEIALGVVGTFSTILGTVSMIRDVKDSLTMIFARLGAVGSVPSITSILSFGHSLNSAAAKAGAVGAIIGGVITWALFFAAWGKGGLSTDSIAFNTLLAGAIAATVLIVVSFILGLTVVGAIVLAIIAIFDLFALIVCKAGVKKACEVGIMQNITKGITQWLYTGEIMIETQDSDNPIVNIEDIRLQLTNPALGLVVGNSVRFNADVLTHVRHNVPTPSTVYHFKNFYTRDDLASTTVRYSLGNAEDKSKPKLNQSRWGLVRNYGSVTSPAPVPLLGWFGAATATKFLYEGFKRDNFSSAVYSFETAKINTSFPLYLNTGMALPRYDCWFGFCAHKSVETASSEDLGSKFILDILPATLGGFYWWSELGVQVDHDGDGLPAYIDPNDTKWDTDGDGLSDAKERELGSDPTKADTDGDGLSDLAEVRHNTTVTNADGDGDGISDYDEIRGYLLTLGGRQIHTVSNPLLRDGDRDGISDGAERRLNGINAAAYAFHPAAFNPSPAALYLAINDLDRVLPVGASLIVTTTVRNTTRLEDRLLARGSYGAELPAEMGGTTSTNTFALLPGTAISMTLDGTTAVGQRFVSVVGNVSADLVPYNTASRAPAADIESENTLPVKIDNDNPNEPTLVLGEYVQPDRSVIIGGNAGDPTSYVDFVEVSVDGSAYVTATGTTIWAFEVAIPD